MSDPVASRFIVVVLGGYGNFGTVISRALAGVPSLKVVVAGRDYRRAATLAAAVGAEAATVDIDHPRLPDKLNELGANLVISTVGPFQGQDYRVANAAIAARAHYVDLADAREFVVGIDALDATARAKDVLVTSGASSVPGLSSAVVDSLLARFSRLDSIQHGICTSEKIPGIATVHALLGYAGKPFSQWRDGQWTEVFGWQGITSHDFSRPMGRRWLATCNVPDLDLFPQRYPTTRSVQFSAGVGFKVSQLGIWLLSWTVRARILSNAAVAAGVLHKAGTLLEPFGSGLSGMFVTLKGQGMDGNSLTLTWELIARQNHGPNIPSMAAVALARKLSSGSLPKRGAVPCIGLITLDEYLTELKGLDITASLYE